MKNGFTYNISEIAIFFRKFFQFKFRYNIRVWSNIIIECAVFSKYKFEFCVFYLFHIGSVGIDKLNEIIHSDFDSIIFSCTYLEEICLKIVLFSCNHNWRPDFLKLLNTPNTAKCYFKTDHNKKQNLFWM